MVSTQIERKRILFEIPDFYWFAQILHERLHAVLYHVEDFDSKFMLITNLYDRNSDRIRKLRETGTDDFEALLYCGVERQRFILEKQAPEYYIAQNGGQWDREAWKALRDKNWAALNNREMTRDMQKVETFPFFDDFREGKLDMASIKIGTLKAYFQKIDNVLKENEYPIISDYFDIEEDMYIGIPLMGMGLFQGIVWIVFKKEESWRFDIPLSVQMKNEKVTYNRAIKRLIKLFQIEYDSLVLSWDVTGVNMRRKSLVKQAIEQVQANNPIQVACDLKKYYEISEFYQTERVKQNDDVVDKIREQFHKTATITILLDSFAHNISAHSLTTLSWWFRERSEYMSDEEQRAVMDAMGLSEANPLIRYTRLKDGGNLSRELYPLFKFLLEKGAFWSGITRQTNFTGKVSSLYNVLWYDFVNNPLYLGTIAHTEEVNKVHIHLTFYEHEEKSENDLFLNTKHVKKSKEGVLLSGCFATINLADFKDKNGKQSVFVEEGPTPLFQALKKELDNTHVFFPGGVIGKHAFFTLLENEIRNVKHFKGDILKQIQQNGLILNISLHLRPVDSNKEEQVANPQLFKIGVWLKHPVNIDAELLTKRIDGLDAQIFTDETFQPRLGGNHQDKICASMLLTNNFDRVQENDTQLGEIYNPWIKTAAHKIDLDENPETATEFEVSRRNYDKVRENSDDFKDMFKPYEGYGYLKKYFHLWKGDNIYTLEAEQATKGAKKNTPAIIAEIIPYENTARFKFLHLSPLTKRFKEELKAEGIIRIIERAEKPASIAEAYQKWLPNWLKVAPADTPQNTLIEFVEDKTKVGRIIYQNGSLHFQNKSQIEDFDLDMDNDFAIDDIVARLSIIVAHGGHFSIESDKFTYRNNGELIQYFCKGKLMGETVSIDTDDLYELFESLATRIGIFDRRIYNRLYMGDAPLATGELRDLEAKRQLQKDRLTLYRDHLQLDFRNETDEDWTLVQQQGFLKYNFLIIHLSYIENMKDSQGNAYTEQGILRFIDEQILQGQSPEAVGDHFILVITTGRGRMAWWDKVKENPAYTRFTTFRPIESILGATEDALQMHDDINLKYNLTKLLFGS